MLLSLTCLPAQVTARPRAFGDRTLKDTELPNSCLSCRVPPESSRATSLRESELCYPRRHLSNQAQALPETAATLAVWHAWTRVLGAGRGTAGPEGRPWAWLSTEMGWAELHPAHSVPGAPSPSLPLVPATPCFWPERAGQPVSM